MPALDLRRAAQNFSAAAGRYERGAQLQAQTRDHLLQLGDARAAAPRVAVDLGCGTGLGARALQMRWPQAAVIGLDLAEGMLRAAQAAGVARCVQADAQRLPLADACCDLLFSNLALQWCPRTQRVFTEAWRVLRPGGLLLCSLPGPGTLRELRLAWRQIDDAEHVHRFSSAASLLAEAQRAGLGCVHQEQRLYQPCHPDVRGLMQGLREIGAGNASTGRRRGLLARSTLARLEAAYAPWRRGDGIYASWEILYLVLRRPA